MTSPDPETLETVEETAQAEEVPIYRVSFERLAQLNRSPVILLSTRRVPSCPSLLTPDHQLNNPKALVDEIANYCVDDE